MKFFVYPYTQASKSAKALAEALDGKRVLLSGSSYKFSDDHVLINWGAGECPHPQALNYKIMDLIEKTRFFKRLDGTGLTPPYATNASDAKKLGYPVFCRTETQGHDGKGIVVADCDGQIVNAKLYVKGIDKTSEYRIHVARDFNGAVVILGGAKKTKLPVSPEMTNVPSDARIWTGETTAFGDFSHSFPPKVAETAIKTLEQFPELTFAALDIVYDNSAAKAYVIEGNSAPMATPQTTKAYAQFFLNYAVAVTEAQAKKQEAEALANLPSSPPAPVAVVEAAAPVRSKEEIAKAISDNLVELIHSLMKV
jgi:hypothetical protein